MRTVLAQLHIGNGAGESTPRKDQPLSSDGESPEGTAAEYGADAGSALHPAAECCYLAFCAVMCALKALGFYEGQTVFTVFMVIACALLLVKLSLTAHTLPEYVIILALLCTGSLTYLCTGEKSLLINLMVIVGIKGVPVKRVIRTWLTMWTCGYAILLLLTLSGLHTETYYVHSKLGLGYILCHTLGYAHSNVLQINYLCICAMILLLAADHFTGRQKLALTALLAAGACIVFAWSLSYTGLLGTFVLFFLYLYAAFRGRLCRLEQLLALLVLPACLLFSLVGPLVIQGALFDKINSALNTRYSLTRWFLTEQPLLPFGTRMSITDYHYTMDCSYGYLLVYLGIVPFVLMMLMLAGLILHLTAAQRTQALAIVLALCVSGVTETFLFNMSFKNIILVLMGGWLYEMTSRLALRHETMTGNELREYTLLRCRGAGQGTCVIGRVCGAFCRCGQRILRLWMKGWRRYLPLALAAGILCGGAASVISRPVTAVYSIVSPGRNAESRILSEEEAQGLRAEGAILPGYEGGEQEVYLLGENAARLEYGRRILSWGAGGALCICCAAAWYEGHERKRKSGGRMIR